MHLDGAMLGRAAYHNPCWLASWDAAFFEVGLAEPIPTRPEPVEALTRERIEEQMCDYLARHMLGLRHGLPGARHWRQVWSDHKLKELSAREVMARAHGAVLVAA